MLVLFDNGTPRTLARYLIEHHTVMEARARGWDRLENGELESYQAQRFQRGRGRECCSSWQLPRGRNGDRALNVEPQNEYISELFAKRRHAELEAILLEALAGESAPRKSEHWAICLHTCYRIQEKNYEAAKVLQAARAVRDTPHLQLIAVNAMLDEASPARILDEIRRIPHPKLSFVNRKLLIAILKVLKAKKTSASDQEYVDHAR